MKQQSKTRNFIANPENWKAFTDLDVLAKKHKKKSFFKIGTRGYRDTFDAIRGALWQFRDTNNAILTGAMWRSNWTYSKDGNIPKRQGRASFGHAFVIDGQKTRDGELRLRVANSAGVDVGDQGFYYFSREQVNKYFTYGAYMFVDMPPELAGKLNEKALSDINNNSRFWKWLKAFLRWPK